MKSLTELSEFIYNLFYSYFQKFDNIIKNDYYKLLILFILSILVAFPDLYSFDNYNLFYKAIDWQKDHLLQSNPYCNEDIGKAVASHMQKRNFRIFIPVILNLFNFNSQTFFYIQWFFSFVFIVVFYKTVMKIVIDKFTSLLLTISIVFTYVVQSYSIIFPVYDCFAFLFLLLIIYTQRKLLIFFFALIALFIDERSFFSLLMITLIPVLSSKLPLSFMKFIKSNFSVLLSISVYFAIRLFLSYNFNLNSGAGKNSDINFLTVLNNYTKFPLVFFMSYEGFWLLIFISIISLILEKELVKVSLLIFTILLLFVSVLFVTDLTRSITYSYVLVFVLLYYLKNNMSLLELRKISIMIFFLCFVIPTYYIYGGINGSCTWITPIFPKILKIITKI